MSGCIIEPDVEAYGSDARASALADVLEVQALTGYSMNKYQLVDYCADANWGRRWADKFSDVGEISAPTSPTATEMAEHAIDCVRSRAELLGPKYPFEILRTGALDRRTDCSDPLAYDLMLAIALAHSYPGVEIGVAPTEFVETVFVRGLCEAGLSAVGLAERRRAGGADYLSVVRSACEEIGLDGDASRAPRRTGAHDGGVDILAHLPLGLRRRSAVAIVAQVTCANSERWGDKFSETRSSMWQAILGNEVSPIPVLALPYHVDHKQLHYLEQGSKGIVLDRLAIAALLNSLTPDEKRVAERLWQISVEAPRWAPSGAVRRSA
ncbi:MAG: hypothetical protein ACQEXJ_21820 [Myxococcota bacterium]